ncbi:MAG: hypothetical protein JSV45_13090 [Chromatiales bacterium]|nr:MAG: hypothetical protein JSV45_13090 [Chromatiales bacterium]
MDLRKLILASAITATFGFSASAVADSQLSIGGTGTQAQASVDFRITIPDFVFFQVGTLGTGDVDLVDFDMAGLESGDSNPVASVGGGLNVVLRSNADNVSLGASGGNLTGAVLLGTIPFAEITATESVGDIQVPDFGTTINLPAGPYNLTDTWDYSYDNTSVYAPDVYTGQVTYTVTTL